MTPADQEHDLIIVGGGTAGCVLAARASDDPYRRVLLLEAGRDVTTLEELPPVLAGHPPCSVRELPDTWRYDVELLKSSSRRMGQFRGRVLGGSSSINGSLFMRGIPEDYDNWGSRAWCFDEVLPYFRKIESDLDFPQDEFHGTTGPLKVSRALDEPLTDSQEKLYERALRAGVAEKPDLNHPLGEGIGRVPMASCSRSTALTYLGSCRARPNLTVVPNVVTTRVLFERDRAVGVEVIQAGATSVIRAHEVVLSAGTFGSAHLLLLSGIGPAEHLRSLGIAAVVDVPGVGENLGCHPTVTLRFNTRPCAADPDQPRLALVHSAGERNNLMLFPKQIANSFDTMITLRLPRSRGDLQLQSADPRVPPRISYGYLDPIDLGRLREGLEMAIDLAQTSPRDEVSDAWLLEHLETADHACGTCELGPPEDGLAVVDETCRVYGVDGLRVVDLSIVPRPVRAGPYATVVMLAERAADLMLNV